MTNFCRLVDVFCSLYFYTVSKSQMKNHLAVKLFYIKSHVSNLLIQRSLKGLKNFSVKLHYCHLT